MLLKNVKFLKYLFFIFTLNIDCYIVGSLHKLFSLSSFVRNITEPNKFLQRYHTKAKVFTSGTLISRKSPSTVQYTGYQLWKVHETNFEKETLQEFCLRYGAEIWNLNQDGLDVLIHQKDTHMAQEYIDKTNITYNVMIDDIQSAIEDTFRIVDNSNSSMPWLSREGSSMDWNRYHDMRDIDNFFQFCLDNYPDITELIRIGKTYNQNNMVILRISSGRIRSPAIFITSGFQGRDWVSSTSITYVISKLLWLWDHDPSSLQKFDWYFLPVVNPDGFKYSWENDRLWVKNRRPFGNCYGANINRNFGYDWGGEGSSFQPCSEFFRGPKPFSESEAKAIRKFVKKIETKLDVFLNFGAYGQLITYPWRDADYITKNYKDLHKAARKARLNIRKMNAAEYEIGSNYQLKSAQSGNIADWIQSYINPEYALNVYLKDQGRYGYLLPPDYIVESGEESFEIIKTVALHA